MTPDANDLCVFAVKRGYIESKEIYCNPLYPTYLSLVEKYQHSPYANGILNNHVAVNPKTDCSLLSDSSEVSFVPMANVQEKTNVVSYDMVAYETVKKGFTVFQRGDLIWAKITPCMQNGKSCIVDKMPTEIGFGSTEFHVIRKRNENVYMPFILSAGGGYLNESMDGLGLNDEKSAQILQNFADLINVYHVSPTAVQKNAMPSAATALAAKQTAMYIDGSWNHLDLMNSGCNWGVGVLPIDENYTTFFDGGSLIIFKSTKHLEASEKLYLWLTNPESSERITELYRTLWMPVQTEYYTDPDKIDFWASEELPARPEGFQDAIVKATYDHAVVATEINLKNFNEINTLVGSALEQVWSGKKTAEEAMTEVKSQTDSLVEGTYSGERS